MHGNCGVITTIAAFLVLAIGLVQAGIGTDQPSMHISLANTATSSYQSPSAPSIRAILAQQQSAWNRGDVAGFVEGYWNAPELTFAGSDGIVRGYDGLLARYKKSYPDKEAMGELDFSGLEIRELGPDAALVLGRWHLKRPAGDVGGVFTLIFERFPVGWRIIHDHTSAQK
jgi:ketosteroid isomerase-like protein